MRIFVQSATAVITALLLAACGGGGDSGSSSSSSSSSTTTSRAILTTPAGTACANDFGNTDAFGNITFQVSQPVGAQAWNCLVVNGNTLIPTVSGTQSVRFEVRPGDCNGNSPPSTYTDCGNDRSRYELMANPNYSTQGQIITYEYYVYIPSQPLIRPATAKGASQTTVMFISQIDNMNQTGTSKFVLFYLAIDESGGLYLSPQKGFASINDTPVVIDSNPANKWIKMKYVIKSTSADDGYVQVYANDKLVLNQTRATLPSSDYHILLKVGIYNAFLSAAASAYDTQVVFFDGFSTSVTNF